MARRRAQAVKRGRPTAPRGRGRPAPKGRGPQGPSRGRPIGRGRSRRRAQASSKSPRARAMASKSPRGRAMARMSPRQRAAMVRSNNARARGPQSRATSRPTVNPGQGLRNFIDTMPKVSQGGGPRAPRGPMSGAQLSNRNRMQNQMQAAAMANMAQASQGGKGRSLFGTMGNVQQRPIPNRDGRLSQLKANAVKPDIARPPRTPRPMPTSDYMRQQMPPQQSQNAMSRGPMPRANIGSVQAPQPNFNKQINQSPRRRRGRIIPRRR